MNGTLDIKDFDYVRFTSADYYGLPRGKVIPKPHLNDALENGIQIYCGILGMGLSGALKAFEPEVTERKFGNCYLKPDISTLRPIPWASMAHRRVGEVMCDLYWDSGFNSPIDAAPREVARQQLIRLDDMGYSLKSGWELEFHLFDADKKTPIYHGKTGYFNQSIFTEFGEILFPLEENLRKIGVDMEALMTEFVDGQFEFTTAPKYGLRSADDAYVAKYAIKEVTKKIGYVASFMTKSSPDAGCGLHFNFSLVDKTGKNAFYDPETSNKLSIIAEHWIAGVMSHARAIFVLHSPTVNCFRRVGFPLGPCKANWGIEDRFASLRVKVNGEKSTYMENRMGGGLGNPYLIVAATLAAGIDGLQRKLKLPSENDPNALDIPRNIQEGIEALREDKIICEALGEQFVRFFTETKLEAEASFLDTGIPETAEAYGKERDFYMDLL
ncbi:unnamed protein product [Owenia fusiformis]|uniref:Lengsin n=1 Tax=Owenia fusiformis TaxID=6347 RepID=A0A8S4Q4N0_OWEFU|nr:unnamed protein product [Owenia fusiformis]